jgi:hypothetical protein
MKEEPAKVSRRKSKDIAALKEPDHLNQEQLNR